MNLIQCGKLSHNYLVKLHAFYCFYTKHVCLAVTSHLHFWQNDRDFFTCYCVNAVVKRIPKSEPAQRVERGEKKEEKKQKKIIPQLLSGIEPATLESPLNYPSSPCTQRRKGAKKKKERKD